MKTYNSRSKYFSYTTVTDLYPIQFGLADCPGGFRVGPISSTNYLFHFVCSGKGYFTLAGQHSRTPIKAGEGFLVPPHHLASYEADANLPWSYCWIEFNGFRAKRLLNKVNLNEKSLIYRSKQGSDKTLITQPIVNLLDSNESQEAFILAQIYLFLDGLEKNSHQIQAIEIHSNQSYYIRKALIFIENNYQHSINVETIANAVQITPTYLNKLFKQELNITPNEFIISYRLNKACDLLGQSGTSSLSIKSIALQCGYANQYYFSNAFKKRYGVSPQQWRQNNPIHYTPEITHSST